MNNKLSKIKHAKYKKLLVKKYRQESKQFIIEGKHIIEEALKHDNLVSTIITSDKLYKNEEIDVQYCSYNEIKQLSTTKTPQEYVAICNFAETKNDLSNVILVLNKINDPGNLGTLIRTACAFGIKDIIVEGVDIYNPKVIRATQGAMFNLNIFNIKDLYSYLKGLKEKGFKLIGSILQGGTDYEKVNVESKKRAIILGNEANGIDREIIDIVDYKVYIPIKFESLNVAVAGGILFTKYCNK